MKILVNGKGMVGYIIYEKIIAQYGSCQTQLKVFGEQLPPAYERKHLSKFIYGTIPNDLSFSFEDVQDVDSSGYILLNCRIE